MEDVQVVAGNNNDENTVEDWKPGNTDQDCTAKISNSKWVFLNCLIVVVSLLLTCYFTPFNIFTKSRNKILGGYAKNAGGTIPVSLPFDIPMQLSPNVSETPFTDEDKKILKGVPKRRNVMPYELWQSEPDNKVYLGNYLIQLMENSKYIDKDNREAVKANYLNLKETIEPLRKFDSDNGCFDFVLAASLIDASIHQKAEREYDKKTKELLSYTPGEYDEELLELSMGHLLNAINKKYIKLYQDDYKRKAIKAYKEPETYSELVQLSLIDSDLGLFIKYYSLFANVSVDYGKKLLDEGNSEKAINVFNIFELLGTSLTKEMFTYFELHSIKDIINYGRHAAGLLEKSGYESEAVLIQNNLDALPNISTEFKKNGVKKHYLHYYKISRYDNILGAPMTGRYLKDEMVKDARLVEYIVLERGMAHLYSLYLAFIIFMGIILNLVLVIVKRNVTPVNLNDDLLFYLKSLSFAFLLPLSVYVILFSFDLSGAKQYEIGRLGGVTMTQCSLIFFAILVFALSTIIKRLRCKCIELEIPAPEPGNISIKIYRIIFVFFTLVCIFPAKFIEINFYSLGSLLLFYILLLIIFIWSFYMGIKCTVKSIFKNRYSLYYRSLVSAVIPVFACILLTANLIIFPCLKLSEKKIITDICEKVKPFGSVPGYATVEEKDIVHYFQKKYKDALNKEE